MIWSMAARGAIACCMVVWVPIRWSVAVAPTARSMAPAVQTRSTAAAVRIAAFSGGGNSEARYAGPRQIQVDQDGDGAVDQAFLMDGVTAANLLTATDFLWL